MSNLVPKSTSSKYPPVPIGDVSETDNSVKNMEHFEDQEQTQTHKNRRKSKQKPKKQRASRVSRLSQLGNVGNRPHRISLAEVEQKNNYFQNGLAKTRCNGCGQITQTILDYRPGCLAFTTCILLSPLGMGSCLLPFFIRSCLDMEQRCIQCECLKRIRRAKCCQ